MMNAGPGRWRPIRSKPSPSSARRISHRTMSGDASSIRALADGTSRAVPTTATSGDPWISAARPSAMAGWSSTIATRITAASLPRPATRARAADLSTRRRSSSTPPRVNLNSRALGGCSPSPGGYREDVASIERSADQTRGIDYRTREPRTPLSRRGDRLLARAHSGAPPPAAARSPRCLCRGVTSPRSRLRGP